MRIASATMLNLDLYPGTKGAAWYWVSLYCSPGTCRAGDGVGEGSALAVVLGCDVAEGAGGEAERGMGV